MELATGTDSEASEENGSVEDSVVETEEQQEEMVEAIVGEKSTWGLATMCRKQRVSTVLLGRRRGW